MPGYYMPTTFAAVTTTTAKPDPAHTPPPVDKTVGVNEALKHAKLPVVAGREMEIVATAPGHELSGIKPNNDRVTFKIDEKFLKFTPDQNNVAETADHLLKMKFAIQYDTALKFNLDLGEGRVAATKDINKVLISYETKDPKADDPKGMKQIFETITKTWSPEKIAELQKQLHMDPQTGKSDLSTDLFYRYENKIALLGKNFCEKAEALKHPAPDPAKEAKISPVTQRDAVRADTHTPAEMVKHMKEMTTRLQLNGKQLNEISEAFDNPSMSHTERMIYVNQQKKIMADVGKDLKEMKACIDSVSTSKTWTEKEVYEFKKGLSIPPNYNASMLRPENLPLPDRIQTYDPQDKKFVESPLKDYLVMQELGDKTKVLSQILDRTVKTANGPVFKTTDTGIRDMIESLNETRNQLGVSGEKLSPPPALALSDQPGVVNPQNVQAMKRYLSQLQAEIRPTQKINDDSVKGLIDDVNSLEYTRKKLGVYAHLTAAPPAVEMNTDKDSVAKMAQYLVKLRDEMQKNMEARGNIITDPYIAQSNRALQTYSAEFLGVDPSTGRATQVPGENPAVTKVRETAINSLGQYFTAQAGQPENRAENLNRLKSALGQIEQQQAGNFTAQEKELFADMRKNFESYIDHQVVSRTGKRSVEYLELQYGNDNLSYAPALRTLNYVTENGQKWSAAQKAEFKERMEYGGFTKSELIDKTKDEFCKYRGAGTDAERKALLQKINDKTLDEDEKRDFDRARFSVSKNVNLERKWMEIKSPDIEANTRFESSFSKSIAQLKSMF